MQNCLPERRCCGTAFELWDGFYDAVEQFFVLWNSFLCCGTVFCAEERFSVLWNSSLLSNIFIVMLEQFFCALEQFIVL
jgi:hypothetical protein